MENVNTYSEHMLNLLNGQEPIPVMEETTVKLEMFLLQMTQADFDRSNAKGKWSARQILAHLADVELIYGYRFRQAVSEERHVVQMVDQLGWAKPYRRLDPSLAVDAFRALRVWNLSLLSTFDLQDWLKEVHHPERGKEDIDLMLRIWAAHDLNHLVQLESIMQSKEYSQ